MNAFPFLECPVQRYMRSNSRAITAQFTTFSPAMNLRASTLNSPSDDDLLSVRTTTSGTSTSDPADLARIDELYRDLATARGEATQMKFYRTKFLSAEKDKKDLRDELLAAKVRIVELEGQSLSQRSA